MKAKRAGKRAWHFIKILARRFKGADSGDQSVLIAYYLLLAIFPVSVVVGNLIAFFGLDTGLAIDYINTLLPDAVQPTLDPIIQDLLQNASGGLLSLGVLAALWSASKAVDHLQKGMNKAYGVEDTGTFVSKRLVQLFTVLLACALVVGFLLLFIFGGQLLRSIIPRFPAARGIAVVFTDIRWPVTVVFLFLMLLVVYRVAPDIKLYFRDSAPGALLATIGLMLLTQLFSLYLRFAENSFANYGGLSTFFVLIFWLNFSARVLVLGAVLNATLYEYWCGKAQEHESQVDNILRKSIPARAEQFAKWWNSPPPGRKPK